MLFTADDHVRIESWMKDLQSTGYAKVEAIFKLKELYQIHKEKGPELGLLLCNSRGAVMQEVILAHEFMSPTKLGFEETRRVCNALVLIQCVASHPDMKMELIKAHIPKDLYPYLNNNHRHELFDKLREKSLDVIVTLLQESGPNTNKIVGYLLEIDMVNDYLRCMVVGGIAAKSMSAFVLGKILEQPEGKAYLGSNLMRFYNFTTKLSRVVNYELSEKAPDAALLLRHILICYLRLCEIPRFDLKLVGFYPKKLTDPNLFCDETSRVLADQVLRDLMVRYTVQPKLREGDHIPSNALLLYQGLPKVEGNQVPPNVEGYQVPPNVIEGYQVPPNAMLGYQLPPNVILGYQLPPNVILGYQVPPNVMAGYQVPPNVMAGYQVPPNVMAGYQVPPNVMAEYQVQPMLL